MLDDDGSRLREFHRDAGRRVEIEEIRKRELLTLHDVHRAEAGATGRCPIPRRPLMRVLPVSQISQLFDGEIHPIGKLDGWPEMAFVGALRAFHAIAVHLRLPQRRRDGRVVFGRMRERLQHQFETERQVRRSIERGQQPRVIVRVDDDEDAAEILGGRTDERGPANVDLLDQRLEWGRRIRGGFTKRIQVDGDDVDEADAVARQRLEIVGAIAPREDAAV